MPETLYLRVSKVKSLGLGGKTLRFSAPRPTVNNSVQSQAREDLINQGISVYVTGFPNEWEEYCIVYAHDYLASQLRVEHFLRTLISRDSEWKHVFSPS